MKKQLQQRELNAAGRRTECLAAIAGAILMFGAGAAQADCVATPDCESLVNRRRLVWRRSKMSVGYEQNVLPPKYVQLSMIKRKCGEQCREVGEQSA